MKGFPRVCIVSSRIRYLHKRYQGRLFPAGTTHAPAVTIDHGSDSIGLMSSYGAWVSRHRSFWFTEPICPPSGDKSWMILFHQYPVNRSRHAGCSTVGIIPSWIHVRIERLFISWSFRRKHCLLASVCSFIVRALNDKEAKYQCWFSSWYRLVSDSLPKMPFHCCMDLSLPSTS